MNAQRSTAVHSILNVTPTIFNMPSLNPRGFERAYLRDDDDAFQALQKFPRDKAGYPFFAPVLFPDQIYKMDLVFRSWILVKVCFLMFSLKAMMKMFFGRFFGYYYSVKARSTGNL